ncbi:MAG: nucleotidyltransferase [Lachnospiraceae bacterium]|nr:nucleotidyltransferase [Lachnospiraceae bacterium]
MKHIGIIAEYNPFHNGHEYQLKKAKELYPDKNIIVLMSGNYVQRGEPAVFNKYLRAQCALSTQADIVFELPLLYATSSAEYFAHASVYAFQKLGVIDTLCFGAETDDLDLLKEIAHILITEPSNYKLFLQEGLRKGNSFPKARMLALKELLHNTDIENIMQQPNNILAIEYLKAIEHCNANITPVIIKRIGNGYHDKDITNTYSSATAIRNNIKDNLADFSHVIPTTSLQHLQNCNFSKPIFTSDLYTMLQYAIWSAKDSLEHYLDVSEDMANILRSIKNYPNTMNELVDILSSKQYTSTRIYRALLHILLDIRKTDMDDAKDNEFIRYLRLLGFRKSSSFILREIKDNCEVPIINKVADAKEILSEQALLLFQKEIHQNHLYTQLFSNKYGIHIPSEYEHSVIISE